MPDLKEVREARLGPYMREMIHSMIKQESNKSLKNVVWSIGLQPDSKEAIKMVMKVAIQFCLNINATDLLFENIYGIFKGKHSDLGELFIKHLQPFILSG